MGVRKFTCRLCVSRGATGAFLLLRGNDLGIRPHEYSRPTRQLGAGERTSLIGDFLSEPAIGNIVAGRAMMAHFSRSGRLAPLLNKCVQIGELLLQEIHFDARDAWSLIRQND
jgi:hypothetical protein